MMSGHLDEANGPVLQKFNSGCQNLGRSCHLRLLVKLKATAPRAFLVGSDSGNSSSSPILRSTAPKMCPPHGAKQTLGVRSAMEDSYIAIPNFLYVNMQDNPETQEKWPSRLQESILSSPPNSMDDTTAPTRENISHNRMGRSGCCEFDVQTRLQEAYFDTFHFFGVFDGHGGAAAAAHCTSHLHRHFVSALKRNEHSETTDPETSDSKTNSSASEQSEFKEPEAHFNNAVAVENKRFQTRTPSRLEVFDVPTEDAVKKSMPLLLNLPNDSELETDLPGAAKDSMPALTRSSSTVEDGEQPSRINYTQLFQRTNKPRPSSGHEVKTPCGASMSPVSQLVPGPVSGHYIEGTSTVQDLEQALTSAFLKTDAEFNKTGGADHTGSTAVCCLVGSRYICVANCGDSRAVMLRSDGVVALTDDHKPDREDEKSRVEAAGGHILYWNGRRVMGVLAMSRAIGDQCLQPYVIPDPEITIIQRREDDELIVMGSDGIWDVLSNEETCHLAKRALNRAHEKGASARSAAKVAATVLIRAALAKGSRDNITVIVVDLRAPESSAPVSTSRDDSSMPGVCSGVVRSTSFHEAQER